MMYPVELDHCVIIRNPKVKEEHMVGLAAVTVFRTVLGDEPDAVPHKKLPNLFFHRAAISHSSSFHEAHGLLHPFSQAPLAICGLLWLWRNSNTIAIRVKAML